MDDDQDYDDLIMEGYDDEFSDLELEEDDADVDLPPPSPLLQCQPHFHHSHSSPLDTSPRSVLLHLQHGQASVEVQPFTSPVGPATVIPESPREVLEMFFGDDLMKLMATESNRYAEVMGSEKFATWTKIT